MRTVIKFVCLLGLSGPCSAYYNSYDRALEWVKRDKSEWGTGVSTLVIIHNNLSDGELVFEEKYSAQGSFYREWERLEIPMRIPAGKYDVFLHTKIPEALYGSKGYVRFRYNPRDGNNVLQVTNVYFGWDSPWSLFYSNKAGAGAVDGEWLLNSGQKERVMEGSIIRGAKVTVDVSFVRGGTSPILKYTVRKL